MKNKKIDGYMTIEASFIIPWVFMTFLLVIYFTFYLYNMCVVYQDCYIAALRGSIITNADTKTVETYINSQIVELLDNQLYEYVKEPNVDVGVVKIKVGAKSGINILDNKLMLIRNKKLDIEQNAIAYRLNPVYVIRTTRR